MTPEAALKIYDRDVAKAWKAYLGETRNLIGFRYEEVEPWAWARLSSSLLEAKALWVKRRGGA